MFRSRRRVPSEGALRVLRQLAYISSGTACGAAAVIAEERRRQTTLVSKIADNSRRLKQHPRYQHAHAAHRRRRDGPAHSDAALTQDEASLPDERLPSQAETFRNNLLPSEVERGYAKLESHPPPSQPRLNPLPESNPTTQPKLRVPVRLHNLSFLTTALESQGPASVVASLATRCGKLVDKNLLQDAFRLFYQGVTHIKETDASPAAYSAGLQLLANRLFDDLLVRQSYTTCHKLLDRMHYEGWPIDQCLHKFALACIEPIRPRWLVWMNERYGDKLSFPSKAHPALCAAYSTRNPQVCALLFAKHIRKADRLPVLSLCEPAWPAIIGHMWSTTHNYNLVDSLFNHMCQSTDRPSLALYNAMIQVCIRSGRVDQAHHHLRTIQQNIGLQPDIVTFGHFVLMTSTDADWPAMHDLMAMLVRAGKAEAPPEKRTDLFVPVLKAYAMHHGPEEVWAFASKAIDEYGVLPDPRITSVGIGNLIRTGRLEMIPAWVNRMRTYDQGAQIDSEAALTMMRQFYFSTRPSYNVLVWLCRRLLNNASEYWSHGILALLREAVVYDLRSYRARLAHRRPQAMLMLKALQEVNPDLPSLPKPLNWNQVRPHLDQAQTHVPLSNSKVQKAIRDEPQTKIHSVDPNHPMLIEDDSSMDGLPDTALSTAAINKVLNENEMLIALSKGKYADLLNLYENSLGQSGLPASSYSLEMAVHAQTKLLGDAELLHDHVDTVSEAGMEITAALIPLLNHRIQNAPPGTRMHADELSKTVRSFYERMVKNSVSIRHHLATSAATVLLENNKANDAIQLLTTIYNSEWAQRVPFDLPAMTVLLQAYIHVSHSLGIRWVIKEVLEKNYRIDFAFRTVIHKAKKQADERIVAGGAKGMNNLRLSRMLEHYSEVCREKQKTQIKRATRLGNRLVDIMIRLARPNPGPAAWMQQAERHGVDPEMWSRRGTTWRVIYRRRKSRKRVVKVDQPFRRQTWKRKRSSIVAKEQGGITST